MLVYIILKHYLPIVLCFISCVAIIPTIYVILRSGLCRHIAVFLVTLAVVDLVACILLTFLALDKFVNPFLENEQTISTFILFEDISGELMDLCLQISNWLTVTVVVERYLAICFPLSVRWISQTTRRKIIAVIFLVAVLLQIPSASRIWPVSQGFWRILKPFDTWFTRVTILLTLPCGILIFVNIRLIQTVRSSGVLSRLPISTTATTASRNCSTFNSRKAPSTHPPIALTFNEAGSTKFRTRRASKIERKITLNLLSLIAVFFFCQVPFIVLSLFYKMYLNGKMEMDQELPNTILLAPPTSLAFEHKTGQDNAQIPDVLAYVRALSVIFLMLKGDLWFLFYCWLCNKFCKAFRSYLKLFCCCR